MAETISQPAKLNGAKSIEAGVEGAVAIAPNDGTPPPPPICKMDIDCCEETFDYLPLKDLRAVGQTCKRMYAVTVHIFKESYPAVKARLYNGNIKTIDGVQLYGYTRAIRSISMEHGQMCDFDYIATNKFGLLKHIQFFYTDLSQSYIDRIREVLGQIESLELVKCRFSGDLYEDMLKFCVNLKCFGVSSLGAISGNGNKWLEQKYPKLEQFKLFLCCSQQFANFSTFLAKNRHIRKLAIGAVTLELNRTSIIESDIKLDCLEIFLHRQRSPIDLLNELHAKGFYQRLEITNVYVFNSHGIDRMILLHGLERIQFGSSVNSDGLNTVAAIVSIKQLEFNRHIESSSKTLAKQLINLERIRFHYAHVYNIRDFIYYSASLKTIVVHELSKGDDRKSDALLKLPKWNTKRAKLDGARKVKLFVDEQVYLNTKWALKTTDFGLIEIKRIAADQ